jgi:hypothetical protein
MIVGDSMEVSLCGAKLAQHFMGKGVATQAVLDSRFRQFDSPTLSIQHAHLYSSKEDGSLLVVPSYDRHQHEPQQR